MDNSVNNNIEHETDFLGGGGWMFFSTGIYLEAQGNQFRNTAGTPILRRSGRFGEYTYNPYKPYSNPCYPLTTASIHVKGCRGPGGIRVWEAFVMGKLASEGQKAEG